MDDIDRIPSEDCMILAESFNGIAEVSTFLYTVDGLITVVPAARPLAEVTANSADVANLWCRGQTLQLVQARCSGAE